MIRIYINYFIVSFLLLSSSILMGQKSKITVLSMDSQGIDFTPVQLGNLLGIEVEKLDLFEVMDRYDVSYLAKKNNLNFEGCFGKLCLVEAGKALNSDKMMSGTVEMYGNKILLSIRLIDVNTETIEKTIVKEFLNFPNEMGAMIRIALFEMFGISMDDMKLIVKSLTNVEQFENKVINPGEEKLNLSGPRIGVTYFTGEAADILNRPKYNGGFDVLPLMFMFGYQFEVQYLNSGNFQALFEFLPSVTGVDQGLFLPNLTFLMGFRHIGNGIEFAVGPTLGVSKQAEGFFDSENNWHLRNEWKDIGGGGKNPYPIEAKLDSRGDFKAHSGLVITVGKSFKSGKMNFPLNIYFIPSKNSIRYGITFGYNLKTNKKNSRKKKINN